MGGFDRMIVDPVIVATAGLVHEKRVVFEAMLLEPSNGHFLMLAGCARSEKCNPVPCFEKFINTFPRTFVRETCLHPLRLFVWHIVGNCPIDIDEIVHDAFLKDWAFLLWHYGVALGVSKVSVFSGDGLTLLAFKSVSLIESFSASSATSSSGTINTSGTIAWMSSNS